MVGSRVGTRMRRAVGAAGVSLAIVAVVGLGLPAQPAGAIRPSKVPEMQCGVVPTTNVKLSADLTCPTPLIIPDNNPAITIDLKGHTFKVDPLPTCFGPFALCTLTDRSGTATVKNGTIDGNVSSLTNDRAHGTVLTRLHVTGAVKTGLYGYLVLSHNVIDGGVEDHNWASIHDNVIANGVWVNDSDAGSPIDIVGNTITGTAPFGTAALSIKVDFDFDFVQGVISGNRISGSTGPGIRISGIASNAMGPLQITGNTITGNAGDGISYAQDIYYSPRFGDNGPITLTRNIVRNNGGHGIDLFESLHGGPAAGVVDGGGNRARGNVLDAQCIGVPCGPVDHRLLPDVVWHNPAAITTETPLGPDQLNATASVPGTFSYSPAAGSLFAVGPWTISVHFVPDDLVNYQPTDRVVQLLVGLPPA